MKQWMLIACSILIVMFTYFVFILIRRRSAKKRANNLTPSPDAVNSDDHSTSESMQPHSVNTEEDTSPVANQQKYQKRMSLRLYKKIYARSIKDDAFWAEQSRSISWIRPFSKSKIEVWIPM